MYILQFLFICYLAESFHYKRNALYKYSVRNKLLLYSTSTSKIVYSSGVDYLIEYLNSQQASELMIALTYTDKKLSEEAR